MINSQSSINPQTKNFQDKKIYDLEERTAKFAKEVIILVRRLPNNTINKRMIEQIIGSAGSIGANYCEASEAESKKDFIHKIGICKKEIKETKHWIRLLAVANEQFTQDLRILWKEAHELLLIFSKITASAKKQN